MDVFVRRMSFRAASSPAPGGKPARGGSINTFPLPVPLGLTPGRVARSSLQVASEEGQMGMDIGIGVDGSKETARQDLRGEFEDKLIVLDDYVTQIGRKHERIYFEKSGVQEISTDFTYRHNQYRQ